ncbi:hypothetical protein QA596_04555 [Balneolales bacterium ANBcel1]|nr:hypothetical protein [Balneolales bacterium ANBcel1]
MILKKFFGKSIEMAKKSARQMYGDDIVILESFSGDGKNDAGVTVLVDSQADPKTSQKASAKPAGDESRFRNVFYKRSDIAAAANRDTEMEKMTAANRNSNADAPAGVSFEPSTGVTNGNDAHGESRPDPERPQKKISNNLKTLRELARKQMEEIDNSRAPRKASDNRNASGDSNSGGATGPEKKTRFRPGAGASKLKGFGRHNPANSGADTEATSSNGTSDKKPVFPNPGNTMGTAEERKKDRFQKDSTDEFLPDNVFSGSPATMNGSSGSVVAGNTGATRKSRFQPDDVAETVGRDTASLVANHQREISALHKRFDKLESLLDSALISSNLDYASHPAFQQLVQTGIKPTVIARWFREIIETGIDPDDEPEQFMSGLSSIIRNALKSDTSGEPEKYMLFTGPSGSGKTHLIMKLVLHPEFLSGKSIAVVTLQPPENAGQPYYTILEPFCADHGITHYTVADSADVRRLQEEWEEYDHVLFDSPAIPVEQESSFRQYWKMRQVLASITKLEVHYVVNASLNRYYFRNSGKVHHPLQPDYVAITHLDEVSEWGPIIPFLEDMGCGARYLSMGASVPGSLADFSPAWFAQQVLQDN